MDRAVAKERSKHQARGGIERARLSELVDAGASIADIGRELGFSKAAVRHWLRRYGLRTRKAQRRAAHEIPDPATDIVLRECGVHGLTEFKRRKSANGFRCLKCRSAAVTKRRRAVKRILVDEAGGRCQACGYDRCVAALEFHHLVPSEKRFAMSHEGVTRALETCRIEAAKCALLCANCHAEVEAGVRALCRV